MNRHEWKNRDWWRRVRLSDGERQRVKGWQGLQIVTSVANCDKHLVTTWKLLWEKSKQMQMVLTCLLDIEGHLASPLTTVHLKDQCLGQRTWEIIILPHWSQEQPLRINSATAVPLFPLAPPFTPFSKSLFLNPWVSKGGGTHQLLWLRVWVTQG